MHDKSCFFLFPLLLRFFNAFQKDTMTSAVTQHAAQQHKDRKCDKKMRGRNENNCAPREGWHGGWCGRHPAHATARCRGSPESLSVAAHRRAGRCVAHPSPAAQAPSLHACTQKEGKTADPCTHSAAHRRTTTLGRADTENPSASAPPAVLHAHKHAHTRHCAGHTRAQAVAQCSFLVLRPLSLRARSCRRGRRWRRPWGRRRAGRTRDGRRR